MTDERGGEANASIRKVERSHTWLALRRWLPRISALLFAATGILSLHFIADALPMILAGAVDLRHFAWLAFGGSASSLAFAFAVYAYRLGKPVVTELRVGFGDEP